MEKIIIDHAEAKEIYKKYIAWLYRLIIEERNAFDLIIGPADSGTFMTQALKIFYGVVKMPAPKILVLPLLRYKELSIDTGDHFDNSILIPDVREALKRLPKLEKVLFVDDEIGLAFTAKESISIVLSSLPKEKISKRIIYTIIAENHGFEWRYDIPPVAIKYYAYANKKSGVNAAIYEILSDEIFNEFVKADGTISKKKVTCLFSNGLVKAIKDNKPILSDDLLMKIKAKLPNFEAYKSDFITEAELLAKQAIDEYRTSKLKLRDRS
jgi:hypothetical protein